MYCDHMNIHHQRLQVLTRRTFLQQAPLGVGAIALGSLLAADGRAAPAEPANPLAPKPPHFAPKAKSVIYLHMSGAPPQLDLFDWKPKLVEHHLQPCPDEILKGERFAFIKGHPKLLGTPHKFRQYGPSGAWISDILPNIAAAADEICIVRSMWTDQFNHSPAELLLYTGAAKAGNASLGSWITYGLGSENQNLPGFVVLLSGGTDPSGGKSLWGSGFLPSAYQGVPFRKGADPVLYLSNPPGLGDGLQRKTLDAVKALNEHRLGVVGDPEIATRIAQYEMAYRMQSSVPDLTDLSKEPPHVLEAYGLKDNPTDGGFARNCLLARRLVELALAKGKDRMKVAVVEWRKEPFEQWWAKTGEQTEMAQAATGQEYRVQAVTAASAAAD